MNEHYFVTADHGHLRIYRVRKDPGQHSPSVEQTEAMDFPAGRQSYTDRDTAMAGRFQRSKHQSSAPGAPAAPGRTGMSIDERLPMQREEERRRARDIAEEIQAFFSARPQATWDLAAGPDLHRTVIEQLSPRVRQQLRRTIAKDLVNQPTESLRSHLVGVPV